MKIFARTAQTSVFVALLFCLLTALSSWAAESSGETAISDETKEQYRQEILGRKGVPQSDRQYVIGYRDILYVEVYGEGAMAVGPGSPAATGAKTPGDNQDFIRGRGAGAEVGTDGRVSLRHLGDVYVVGMTLGQLADYLKKLYATVYESPNVITSLVQSNSRQYTMMGQIKNPGLFHLDHPITVVKAIAKAGGFTEWASSRVTIIRQENELIPGKGEGKAGSQTQKFEFDYDDFLKGRDMEKNVQIEPGDVVVAH